MTQDNDPTNNSDVDNLRPGYTAAARASSLAEAGYLVSVLQSEGLDAEVQHTKSYSAISGGWLTDYVISAPEDQLHEVAAVLRAEATAFEEDSELEDPDEEIFRQVVWRPVALMAVAGVVSFIAGQHLAAPKPNTGPWSLGKAVDSVGRPFYTEAGPDGGRHRLTFDRKSSEWRLDSDVDGDGRFDRRLRFAAEAALPARLP